MVDTKTVLDKLLCIQEGAVHRIIIWRGPGGFRRVCTVGDLGAMYDEYTLIWRVIKLRLQSLVCQSGQVGGCANG